MSDPQTRPFAAMTGAIDNTSFRYALGHFPTGVAIVTTLDRQGAPVGMTCNSFSSVSLDPPLVLWSLRNQSRTYAAFRQAGVFAVNVLAQDQTALSARFAGSAPDDRFATVAWSRGKLGLPLIDQSIAQFECRTHAVHDAGDHTVFIGKVEYLDGPRQEDALVFYRGAYRRMAQTLPPRAGSEAFGADKLREAISVVFGPLVRLACERGTTADFDAIEDVLQRLDGLARLEDTAARQQADSTYLRLIARAAHNDVLADAAESLIAVLHQRFTAKATSRDRSELMSLRRGILRQLRLRNAAAAVQALEGYCQVRLPPAQPRAGASELAVA